jgi:hemolysin activation/secretion protein
MCARPLAAILFALSLAPSLWAQAGSGAAERPGPVFKITGFDVAGVNPLAVGETSNVLAPFLRADATIETLQKATAALEAALKDRGYGLYRVSLLPQELDGGIVKLEIVRYLVGKVVIEGATNHSEANILGSVPELAQGQTPNFRTLAVQTAIANESQGKQIQVVLKESTQPDTIDARVVVKESKDWNFSVSLNNSGTKATGRDRFSLAGGHANLFDLDHNFSAAYTTSLANTSDVRQLGLNYKVPLYKLGGVLGFSHTRSDVTGNFGPFSSNGAGQTMGLSYSHYMYPEGGRRSNVTLGFDDKRFDPTLINGVLVPGQLERRTRPVSLGYNVRVETDKSAYGYNLDLVANVPGGAGNNLTAYQSEDPRIRSASFRLLRAGVNYLGGLGSGWMLGLRGQIQYSPDALISGEQFGIGGASSVRGTSERPVSGDRGFFGSVELTSPELRPGLRWAGFVDAGFVGSETSPASPKLAHDRLASFGLGLRYSLGRLSASAEWSRLFMGSRLPLALNSESPQKGDHKLHVNLSIRF